MLEIFSIFPSASFVGCFDLFFTLFSLVGFVFLVVYALYTPWGFFGLNTLAYQSKKKMKGPNTLKLTSTSLERRSHQDVCTSFVNSNDQLEDIFTKSLRGPRIKYIYNKLSAYDIYAPS